MHNFELKNKVAIITGGAQSFGLDIAKRFIKSSSKVIILDTDEAELKMHLLKSIVITKL